MDIFICGIAIFMIVLACVGFQAVLNNIDVWFYDAPASYEVMHADPLPAPVKKHKRLKPRYTYTLNEYQIDINQAIDDSWQYQVFWHGEALTNVNDGYKDPAKCAALAFAWISAEYEHDALEDLQ